MACPTGQAFVGYDVWMLFEVTLRILRFVCRHSDPRRPLYNIAGSLQSIMWEARRQRTDA